MNQAIRIQTSFINGLEKKALIWIAKRLPRWVTSDMLTAVGTLGALVVAIGFALSGRSIQWLWLSSAGLVVNWFGDSLDGTLARVRNCQRPIYGYYVDHTVDCVNEGLMFIGAGLSPFLHLEFALLAFAIYLVLTINVSINAHLKGEFRLTYIKLGPTEFRLIIIIADTLLIAIPALTAICHSYTLLGHFITMRILDYVAVVIIGFMSLIYIATTISDARKYAVIDPPKKPQKTTDE
ncbi:MAG: CDP-alcohol phosphatidyltransferase [Bacteroidales bacterium]|nr:CDP-alcohol phosphatidyltransferase [Bacteroidales bacterium]